MNRMTPLYLLVAGLTIGAVAFFVIHRMRSSHKAILKLETETYDGVLDLQQVTAFFRSLELQKSVHTPFIAKGDTPQIKSKFTKDSLPLMKPTYICLIAGVYEEGENTIRLGKVFYAKGFDNKLQKILEDGQLVVLS